MRDQDQTNDAESAKRRSLDAALSVSDTRAGRGAARSATSSVVSNGIAAAEHTAIQSVAAADSATAPRLLVDPGMPAEPHQLRIDELFALLRPAVIAASNRELARVQRSADTCPYLIAWLAYYESRPALHVERAIAHYTGAAASSGQDLVGLVVKAAVASVRRWIDTGEVTGIPGGVDPTKPPTAARSPLAQLGPGTPMPEGARAAVEQALGERLDDVRLHTDDRAHAATTSVAARAFSIGPHVAFAAGEYQPDTMEGALMLAHELAHVAQSRGSDVDEDVGTEDASLEQNADEVALAIATGRPARPRKRRGLRLQRCPDNDAPTPKPVPPPPAPAPHCKKPTVSVTRTGHQMFLGSSVPAVQPTDVAGELACEQFELREDVTAGGTTHPKGTVVLPMTWDNALPTVHVMIDGTAIEFDVLKWKIRPKRPVVADVAPYDTHLDSTTKKLAAKQVELDALIARKDEFKTKPEKWEAQRDALTKLRDDYANVVNELQIQQTMYNRFDPAIAAAVAKANADHGLTGADRLDPNIVKAMIFHETEMGTSGPFIEDTDPNVNHVIMNHFNIPQAIDSFGAMYAEYFLKNDPARTTTFALTDIKKDLRKSQARKDKLEKQATRTAAEDVELADLVDKSGPRGSWETFLRAYPGLLDAMNDLYASGGATPLNLTYEHWIEMMVFEIFEKKRSGETWADAVRRYNGAGKNAKNYRDAVTKRAKDAVAAEKAKKSFIPKR